MQFNQVPTIAHLPLKQGIKAIAWDMDGTLLNTERFHHQALEQCFPNLPLAPDKFYQLSLGQTDSWVIQYILQNYPQYKGLDESTILRKKAEFLHQTILQSPHHLLCSESLVDLLHELSLLKIPLALVTSSERATTEFCLGLLDLKKFFSVVITRQEVPFPKPHPSPYLLASSHLGIEPQELLVFEDSPVGLESATKAGCKAYKACWY